MISSSSISGMISDSSEATGIACESSFSETISDSIDVTGVASNSLMAALRSEESTGFILDGSTSATVSVRLLDIGLVNEGQRMLILLALLLNSDCRSEETNIEDLERCRARYVFKDLVARL